MDGLCRFHGTFKLLRLLVCLFGQCSDYMVPIIVVAVVGIISSSIGSSALAIISLILGLIMWVYTIGEFLPGLAVIVGHLHDTGYTRPYIFTIFIPFVG